MRSRRSAFAVPSGFCVSRVKVRAGGVVAGQALADVPAAPSLTPCGERAAVPGSR